MDLNNVLTHINTLYYIVDLVNGNVKVQATDIVSSGPYKLCRNVTEANFFSLNILRQNVFENNFKNKNEQRWIHRTFLGIYQELETEKIIPTMDWLQETFPDKFI